MEPTFEYTFPVIRGVQAGREYYVSMCPLRLLSKIFLFDEEEIIPETFSSQALLKQAKEDLRHPDPKVKILAIQYLEKVNSSITVPLLQEVLSDRDSGVRTQALRSLIKIRNPTVYPLLKNISETMISR
jgi:hypothetical protein